MDGCMDPRTDWRTREDSLWGMHCRRSRHVGGHMDGRTDGRTDGLNVRGNLVLELCSRYEPTNSGLQI